MTLIIMTDNGTTIIIFLITFNTGKRFQKRCHHSKELLLKSNLTGSHACVPRKKIPVHFRVFYEKDTQTWRRRMAPHNVKTGTA